MSIRSYRDLEAWQLGMSLTEAVYELTTTFPRHELFGLTTQVRRAAASIPAQLAEGHPQSTRSYRHYIRMALGSQAECETHLELARRLGLASAARIDPVAAATARVGRVLHGLLKSLPRD